jgi:predicted MFS family arabinose efflux permease
VWNVAIAGGGVLGGVLLDTRGAGAFPWAVVALLVPTLVVAWRARGHGFPPAHRA